MESLVYTALLEALSLGEVVPSVDSFRLMLVTDAYVADKSHEKRDEVTNEVTGTGYSAGGAAVTCSQGGDATSVTFTFGTVDWPASTLTARGGVIYKDRGGAATEDELVAYVDFGADVETVNGTFRVTFTSPITLQN